MDLELEETKTVMFKEASIQKSVHKVAILGKMMSDWNFLLINRIQIELR